VRERGREEEGCVGEWSGGDRVWVWGIKFYPHTHTPKTDGLVNFPLLWLRWKPLTGKLLYAGDGNGFSFNGWHNER